MRANCSKPKSLAWNGGFDFREFEWHYLQRLLHSDLPTLRSPQFSQFSPLLKANRVVEFRPGTTQLAWVAWPRDGHSSQAVLSDVVTGKSIHTFPNVWDVYFSPNGKYLGGFTYENSRKLGGSGLTRTLSDLSDGFLTVWDADTGKKLATRPRSRIGRVQSQRKLSGRDCPSRRQYRIDPSRGRPKRDPPMGVGHRHGLGRLSGSMERGFRRDF